MTYAHVQFEVATSNGLGGDVFTKKIDYLTMTLGPRAQETLSSTLYIMWPMQLQSLKLLGLTV